MSNDEKQGQDCCYPPFDNLIVHPSYAIYLIITNSMKIPALNREQRNYLGIEWFEIGGSPIFKIILFIKFLDINLIFQTDETIIVGEFLSGKENVVVVHGHRCARVNKLSTRRQSADLSRALIN